MKKILIFEYITGGGLIDKKISHNLTNEANIPDSDNVSSVLFERNTT